ncbi:MAG: hypothetical protein M3N59_01870 [bacterium]|nr:hypothetical protein [bacterium]
MKHLQDLAPWQIILVAIGTLIIVLVGGYFLVTMLTTTPPTEEAKATVPADLGGEQNAEVLTQFEVFEEPKDLPEAPEPVQTIDPNAPSTVNPFE